MKKLTLYEILFLFGIFTYNIGQYLIFIYFNNIEKLHNQEPIDFSHWFMIIGVLFLIPQIGNFPKSKLNYISSPSLIFGICLIIGMCVLNFVFWSLKDPEFKSQVAKHLVNTTEIWTPFMKISGKIFTFGLLTSSFNYFKKSKLGVLLVTLGVLVVYLPWVGGIIYLVIY